MGFCQSKKNTLFNDSTTVYGYVNENVFVGQSTGLNCFGGSDLFLSKGTIVIVSGVNSCKYSGSETINPFFEILVNCKTYYIEKDKLYTENDYYSILDTLPIPIIIKFKMNALKQAELKLSRDKKNLLTYKNLTVSKGLAVAEWSFYDESEYTNGTSVKIVVSNPTKKIIKYIWFTFTGFNSVGDKIIDAKRGSNIIMQAIGPINPEETATYEYKYVWFSDLVESAKIVSIKVQYMDGSFKTIIKPSDIIFPAGLNYLISKEE